MEDFSRIETAISISQTSNEGAQEAIDFLTSIEMEEIGLNWAISRISEISSLPHIKRALLFITHWCQNKWDDIPADSVEQIRTILFASSFIDTYYSDQSFRNILGSAEVSFMWNMYPDNWPSFWSDISSFSPQKILNFLLSFDSYSKFLDPRNHAIYNRIKNGMRGDHSDEAITDFAISQLDPKKKETFTVYAFLLSWVNREYILKETALTIVNDAMSEKSTAAMSLMIFRTIIERGMPDEEKMQIISDLSIAERVNLIIENFSEEEPIVIEAAMLLNSTGKQIIETELLETYLTIALQLLMYQSNEVALAVTQFIYNSIKGRPEICNQVAQNAYVRLASYFESDSLFDEALPNKLIEIVGRCIRTNTDEVLPYITSLFEEADTIQDICACLDICCFSFRDNSIPDVTKAVVEHFNGILEISEIENDQQLTAITLFATFFASVASTFDAETIGAIFVGVLAFATNDDLDPTFHIQIGNLLQQIARNQSVIQAVEPSSILEMVQTLDSPILSTAAKLVSYLQEEAQDDTLGSCIGVLQQAIESADESETISVIKQTLVFLRSIIVDKVPNFAAYVQEFLLSLHDYAVQDDETFGIYIATVVNTLNVASLEHVLQLIPEVNGIHSLSAIAEAFHVLAKGENKEWCLEAMNAIKGSVFEEYSKVSEWNTENETRTIIMQLLSAFIGFTSIAVHQVLEDDELRSFVHEKMCERFDTPTLLCDFIDFGIHAVPVNAEAVADLALPVISFLFCPKFDHQQVSWKAVIRLSAEFHRLLAEAGGGQEVANALGEVGATEEMVSEYMATFSLPKQQRGKAAIEFYGKLKKFRDENQL